MFSRTARRNRKKALAAGGGRKAEIALEKFYIESNPETADVEFRESDFSTTVPGGGGGVEDPTAGDATADDDDDGGTMATAQDPHAAAAGDEVVERAV